MTLRIGISTALMPPDANRFLYHSKTLIYAEETMAHWIMSEGAIPHLLPRPHAGFSYDDLAGWIDGLILQGGTDVAPENYGEQPLHSYLNGDPERDVYDFGLIEACLKRDMPILGICRGCQVLNVYFGGSLYQHIEEQREESPSHRDHDLYDQHTHRVRILPDSILAEIYPQSPAATVNSVHRQAVKDPGTGVVLEALSEDGVVEAFSVTGPRFCLGIQWHPEFHYTSDVPVLDPQPLMRRFLREAGS